MSDPRPIRTALLSVSDKTGLADLGRALARHGAMLISTGGTAAHLRQAGLTVRDVSEVTGAPEMLEGRVKTLHPAVHGGLLARRGDPDHVAAMRSAGFDEIDLAVVNLYPFEAAVARGASAAECTENIDIGGPAMIRAAAKNHEAVAVVTDPEDYPGLVEELEAQGGTRRALRERLAQTAFARTAAYDAAVSNWMAREFTIEAPRRKVTAARRATAMRYGENPHQGAALYLGGDAAPGPATAMQLQGKALSYNNIADADAAFELASELGDGTPACVIVKHANPCGAARAATLAEAYRRARDCDRTSSFGGIVALTRPLDAETAAEIAELFTEVVIAPGADEAARDILAGKSNLRLQTTPALADPARPGEVWRQVAGGWLIQDRDAWRIGEADLKIVTRRAPDPAQMSDLLFAWTVAKHVKSNAIVYARDGATVGIGAGQMSRVDSTRIAAAKAAEMARALGLAASPAEGACVASDAFFPFPDGLLAAAEAGAGAVIQPGGSVRDDAVIAAADDAGLAMVFTGMRHFRH